jgi:putative FmdB family regulatory protein
MPGMPIYEYRCKSCEKTFEVIQGFGDGALRKCRECSGRLEKLVSRTAFLLKGGGWYAEGYSRSGSKKRGDTPKPKDAAASASKSDSKPTKSGGKDGKD